MSLPTPDAQSSRPLSQQPYPASTPTPPSKPLTPHYTPRPSAPLTPPTFLPSTEASDRIGRIGSSNPANSSWDQATDGLKTLTAKRELLPRPERRPADTQSGMYITSQSYTFLLVILACIVVMLISGGIVFFLMLQP